MEMIFNYWNQLCLTPNNNWLSVFTEIHYLTLKCMAIWAFAFSKILKLKYMKTYIIIGHYLQPDLLKRVLPTQSSLIGSSGSQFSERLLLLVLSDWLHYSWLRNRNSTFVLLLRNLKCYRLLLIRRGRRCMGTNRWFWSNGSCRWPMDGKRNLYKLSVIHHSKKHTVFWLLLRQSLPFFDYHPSREVPVRFSWRKD